MLEPTFWNNILVIPILNILLGFYNLFLTIHLPAAFGLAIISLTVLIRLILLPFYKQQTETTRKMQEIKPHLDKLQLKHKGDAKMLQQEQMKLYQQAGINPAAGCLFMVIQIPVFFALYQTLNLFLRHTTESSILVAINKVAYFSFLKIHTIDPWFFGFNLAVTPAKGGEWYYYLVPVVTGILQYFQAQATMPAMAAPQVKPEEKKLKKGEEKKSDTMGDFQKAMNTQMKYIFPFLLAWFSYSLPVGLSLYWNIFSIFSIIQYKRSQVKTAQKSLKIS